VRDPIPKFEAWLEEHGVMNADGIGEARLKAQAEVDDATDWAEEQPPPAEDDLYTHVYASGPLS